MISVISTPDGEFPGNLICRPNGSFQVPFVASSGLYQFSVVADAREFNWEELYIKLDKFGNKGQRTGPWDFDIDDNKPLVPSYWVALNGRSIGLWFFQRISLADIEHQRFRGRMAFWMRDGGPAVLEFTPYRQMNLSWVAARLEPDPVDELQPGLCEKITRAHVAAMDWADPEFWCEQRQRLSSTHTIYRDPLRRAWNWLCKKNRQDVMDLPLLIAAANLEERPELVAHALQILDETVAREHWGNPNSDGYGYDGDIAAGRTMRILAWAYHALGNELGKARKSRFLEKLKLQGERFVELSLLNRDYWGGSVMQDHGRISMTAFGTAVLHLVGVLPEARQWLEYIVPRAQRGIAAMPRDGVIPQSSYGLPSLYLEEMTFYRDAMLTCCGHDIFDDGPFHEIVDFVSKTLHLETYKIIAPNYSLGEKQRLDGGHAFFNCMASKYKDGRAAYLQQVLLQQPDDTFPVKAHSATLWGFLSFDPAVAPIKELPKQPALNYFPDSGVIHYHDKKSHVTLTARCGPWLGYHAERVAKGPMDRMGGTPGAGHFSVLIKGQSLLTTPEAAYSLRSAICTCLLINGKGQYGDIGYPMSIPDYRYRGEEIEVVYWDESSGSGVARFNLQPAYPDELGVAIYTRELIFKAGDSIICHDYVVLDEPCQLSWLFQGKQANGITLEDEGKARFGSTPSLYLNPIPLGVGLLMSIHPTEVVWAYSSESNYTPFSHLRYDSTAPVAAAAVDFIFTW